MYYTEGWFQLVYSLRTQLAQCQRFLRHDAEYITSCIGLLSPQLDMSPEERAFYADEFIYVAHNLSTGINF